MCCEAAWSPTEHLMKKASNWSTQNELFPVQAEPNNKSAKLRSSLLDQLKQMLDCQDLQ